MPILTINFDSFNCLRFSSRLAYLLALAGSLLAFGAASSAFGQATFSRNRCLSVDVAYEDVLERLSGEEPCRELFASQDVQLRSYSPRELDPESAPAGVMQATIDIVGWSCEYGQMRYTMNIMATDKQTTITVGLNRPVDRVLSQVYEFAIQPQGAETTQVCIRHTLCVRVTKRQLRAVNELIRQVTYNKSNQIIDQLTPRMARTVAAVAKREPIPAMPPVAAAATTEATTDPLASGLASPQQETELELEPVRVNPKPQPRTAIAKAEDMGSLDVPRRNDNSNLESETSSEVVEPAPTAASPRLLVTITGAKGTSGEMHVSIFNSPKQYEDCDVRRAPANQGPMFRQKSVAVTAKNAAAVTVAFEDLPPGTYGVVGFHDINSDRRLNANFLGQPSEPYGFSKNARNPLGPPPFAKITIPFGSEDTEVEFHVK